MPNFSLELTMALHKALAIADEHKHGYATLEHLLLSLVRTESGSNLVRACGVDPDALATDLTTYVDTELGPLVVYANLLPSKPTPAFQRVVQRGVIYTQSNDKDEVNVEKVFLGLFAELESCAFLFLRQHGIERHQVVSIIQQQDNPISRKDNFQKTALALIALAETPAGKTVLDGCNVDAAHLCEMLRLQYGPSKPTALPGSAGPTAEARPQ